MSHEIRTSAGNRVWGLLLSDREDEIEETDILAIEAEAEQPHVGHTPCCFIPSHHKWADPIRCLEDHEDWPCAAIQAEGTER